MLSRSLAATFALTFAFTFASFAQQNQPGAQPGDQNRESPGVEFGQDSVHDEKDLSAEKVLNKLHKKNQKEIQIGELAAKKSDNQQIEEFANMLVRDHKQADQQIKQLASEKNIELKDPKDYEAMHKSDSPDFDHHAKAHEDPNSDEARECVEAKKHKDKLDKLQALSGEQFDRQFVLMMDKGHEKTLSMIDNAKQQLDGEDITRVLSQIADTLRKHENQAEQLARDFGIQPGQGRETVSVLER